MRLTLRSWLLRNFFVACALLVIAGCGGAGGPPANGGGDPGGGSTTLEGSVSVHEAVSQADGYLVFSDVPGEAVVTRLLDSSTLAPLGGRYAKLSTDGTRGLLFAPSLGTTLAAKFISIDDVHATPTLLAPAQEVRALTLAAETVLDKVSAVAQDLFNGLHLTNTKIKAQGVPRDDVADTLYGYFAQDVGEDMTIDIATKGIEFAGKKTYDVVGIVLHAIRAVHDLQTAAALSEFSPLQTFDIYETTSGIWPLEFTFISVIPGRIGGPAPLQSDLQVQSVAISPANCTPGSTVTVSFTLTNDAAGAAEAQITLIESVPSPATPLGAGDELVTLAFPRLEAGETRTVSQVVVVPFGTPVGMRYVRVSADSDRQSNQSDYSNDAGLALIAVSAPSNPVPHVSAVTPDPVPASASAQWVTISGSGFVAGCTATLANLTSGGGASDVPTSYLGADAVALYANLSNAQSSWVVTVVNPGDVSSAPFAFSVAASSGGADLQVLNGAVSLAGGTVSASWTIKNLGTGAANASTTAVRINQSTTNSVGANLTTVSTNSLGVNATHAQSASLTASTTAGTYSVWVLADNYSTSGQSSGTAANDIVRIGSFTVTGATDPDLQVLNGAVSLSSGTVSANWTIKNLGTGTANASTTAVRINQSTTSAAGSNLSTVNTNSLGVNATHAQSASLTASTTPGTYYVWVLADNYSTSGQSSGAAANDIVRIGSFTVAGIPDLQVLNGTVSLSSGTVSANWTIKNLGTGAASTSTAVVRINQSTTSASGSNLSSVNTNSLAVNATHAQSASLTASTTAGTYYVWVLADNYSTSGQSSSTAANDIVRIGSFTVTGTPDLQVLNGAVSLSSGTVSASWTIKNLGTGAANASTTAVRINQSTTSASGSNLSTVNTNSLAVNATHSQSASLTASTTPGTYYVWVIADNYSTSGQSSATAANDIVRIGSFTVTAPDLQVLNGSVSYSSGTVSTSWTIKNVGTVTASASTTVVRINQSSTSASGSNLASINTNSLTGGSTHAQSKSLTAPSASGTYYVWVIADNYNTSGQSSSTAANDIVRIGSFTK